MPKPGMWYLLSLLLVAICAAQTTDGGRGELPGMRKDIFDQMKDAKNKGPPSKCHIISLSFLQKVRDGQSPSPIADGMGVSKTDKIREREREITP